MSVPSGTSFARNCTLVTLPSESEAVAAKAMVAGAANVASGTGVSIVTVGGTLATSGITLTLSNVTVFNAPVLWLVTGRPTYTGVGNVIVVRPSSFQVAPSLLQEPITVVASR